MTVVLEGEHATDDAIKALDPDLLELELILWPSSEVSLAGLKSMARLTNLKYVLFTFSSNVTTDPQFAQGALEALKDAKGIEKLDLTGGVFTPEVLSHLSEFQSLKELTIADTHTLKPGWNLEGLEGMCVRYRIGKQSLSVMVYGR